MGEVLSITTERLHLRVPRTADALALSQRRSDPEVARYQSWPAPYDLERAKALIREATIDDDPPVDEWFMLTIADKDDQTIYGDFALKLGNEGRSAEVGCTLAKEHWGSGIASESLDAVIDWLFEERGVLRIVGMLHPDNLRSARVLELCGFDFEGHTKNSFWDGEEASDDLIYGLTPELVDRWRSRPQDRPGVIELVEPYPTGLRDVIALRTHHSQERFVSPISSSLAQVAVPPVENGGVIVPWPRIIHADGEPVGLVMLTQPTETEPVPFLWRLLIDRHHQRRGIGKRVIELVKDEVRSWGEPALLVSWVPGIGSPEPLYLASGFVPTGEIIDGEVVGRADLST